MKAVMMLVVVCGVVSCTMTEAQTISEVWKCEKNDVMMLIMCGRGVQEGEGEGMFVSVGSSHWGEGTEEN